MNSIWHTLGAAGAILFLLSLPTPARTQGAPPTDWNDEQTLELVRRGIERRSLALVDSALRTYSAQGRGYVYFLLDAPGLERQTLVRTDQVAVEVYWRAPGDVRQRIVGLRERRELPVTGLNYYLDRMTVVQDDYGQSIVIADGDNVSDVPHPIGVRGAQIYDYRLADSLTLRLPGVSEPVRIREVRVRPKDPTIPAVVGSVFLEAATGAVVRMAFTFTPSAYIDPRLDFIQVTLENGFWDGRFWLPHEQRLEIRRELPELDLPFGTVIRTRMRVDDYRFNLPLSELFFAGPGPVTMLPKEAREGFAFDRPIDAEWELEGIGQPATVDEIRGEARAIVGERLVSGLPRSRPAIGSLSDVLRYNRAEGATVGFGWGFRAPHDIGARLHGGWAFGSEHPFASIELGAGEESALTIRAYANRRGDVGRTVPASGAANTFAAFLFANDWTDPFFASGGEAVLHLPLGSAWSLRPSARFERQRSAELTSTYSVFGADHDFRPVQSIDAGNLAAVALALRRDQTLATGGWRIAMDVAGGRLATADEPRDFGRLELTGGMSWVRSPRRARLDLTGTAGVTLGDVPLQELYLIGGRGTLPGYGYRSFVGDRVALGRITGSFDLAHPWVRARLFAGAGWAGLGSGGRATESWGATASAGVRPTVGLGLGIFYDLLHIDVARGLRGGRSELIIEVQPEFWPIL